MLSLVYVIEARAASTGKSKMAELIQQRINPHHPMFFQRSWELRYMKTFIPIIVLIKGFYLIGKTR